MPKDAILVVDDEAIIVLALTQELRKSLGPKYRYETALSGEDALALVDELTAEGSLLAACVSDCLMPGMHGDELLTRLRERTPSAVLVLITGQADDEALSRAERDAGILACVRKPWRPNEIGALITAALGAAAH